jgi:hypothetical protein
VKRIGDLALTLQEVVGGETERPISVRWSKDLTLLYSPRDFMDRIEEDRLAKAELIKISSAAANLEACIRLSGRHGEPGAELGVTGPDSKRAFERLKAAVELGPWRPMSSERLAAVAGGIGFAAIMIVEQLLLPESFSLLGFLVVLVVGIVAGVTFGVTYALAARALVRWLLPPLEIRASGTKGLTVLASVFRWAVPGLPAALAALGISQLVG